MYLDVVFILSFGGFSCNDGFVVSLNFLLTRRLFCDCGLESRFILFSRSLLINSLIYEVLFVARLGLSFCL